MKYTVDAEVREDSRVSEYRLGRFGWRKLRSVSPVLDDLVFFSLDDTLEFTVPGIVDFDGRDFPVNVERVGDFCRVLDNCASIFPRVHRVSPSGFSKEGLRAVLSAEDVSVRYVLMDAHGVFSLADEVDLYDPRNAVFYEVFEMGCDISSFEIVQDAEFFEEISLCLFDAWIEHLRSRRLSIEASSAFCDEESLRHELEHVLRKYYRRKTY